MGSNWKTTLSLLVGVLALSVWVWLGEAHLESDAELDPGKILLQHLKPEAVLGLEIVRSEKPDQPQERVVIERLPAEKGKEEEDARWQLKAPVDTRADDARVNGLINNLQYAQYASRVRGAEAARFDFGRTVLQVTIGRRETFPYVIQVGEKRPSGEHPLKIEGREGVYLVRGDLIATNFPADMFEWRTKEVLTLGGAAIERVQVERPDGPALQLAWLEQFWRLGGAAGEYAIPSRVEELLRALRGVRAKGVEVEAPGPADLERTGLAAGAVRLALEAAPEAAGKPRRSEELLLGGPVAGQEGQRFARVGGAGPVYRIDAAALLAALDGDEAAWRSDALFPLSGSGDTVTGFAARWAEGGEWQVKKQDDGWSFAGPDVQGKVEAAAGKCSELAKELAKLAVAERPAAVDSAATGLGQPHLRIGLDEGSLHRELEVGSPLEGRPGVYYVARTGDPRVLVADLGALPGRLRDARLALIDPVLLRASHFDLKRLRLLDAAGKPELEAEKQKEKVEGAERDVWKVPVQPASAPADGEVFAGWLEAFDQVPVASWVALDSEQARRDTGLDAPRKLVLTVEVFKEGKQVEEERTLLLGRREGARIHALNPDRAGAIGLIDAAFLDRLARGFARGQELLSFDKFQARRLELREGERLVLELDKPREVWLRGTQVVENTEVERLLEGLSHLEVTRGERATPERLAETGLAAPARRITVLLRPFDGSPDQTKVLLLGGAASEHEAWAMLEGGETLGSLFLEPVRALDRWAAEHPLADPFPPVGPGDTGPVDSTIPGEKPPQDGTAHVDSPR